MSQKDIVIASAARTPIGSFQGVLSPLSASDLGAIAVREAIKRAGAKSEHEGHGYVQSDDVVNEGFTQGQESFVRVQVVYDEPLPLNN